MKKRIIGLAVLIVAALSMTAVAFAGSPKILYDTTLPNGPATNLSSAAFEATATSEFGGALSLPAGKSITNFTVTMSSWACQSGNWFDSNCTSASNATFAQPITLNIYAPSDTVNPIATSTQTFAIPYRPSSTAASAAKCLGDTTAWYQPAQGHNAGGCYHGVTSNVTFNLSGVTVPTNGIVYGIAFQTRDYGLNGGSGISGPADSLNVALNDTFTTTPPNTGSIWLDSSWSGAYCDSATNTTTGTFRADAGNGLNNGCWSPLVPAVKVGS
jgi:hypothetical protein